MATLLLDGSATRPATAPANSTSAPYAGPRPRHDPQTPYIGLTGDPQRGVPGEHVEVVVAVEQGRPVADGDYGDQAAG